MERNEKRESSLASPGLQKYIFDFSSRLTRRFPKMGARFLDATFLPALGNPWLVSLSKYLQKREIRRCRSFRRFLIVPDCHIGDSVMAQSAAAAIRDFFPGADVDYVVNKTAFPLIEGNPDLTRIIPLFSGGAFLSVAEKSALRRLLAEGGYDLCLSFSPFLKRGEIGFPGTGFLDFMIRTPMIINNERRPARINHFIYQQYDFTRESLALMARPMRDDLFSGVPVTLSDAAVDQSFRFAVECGLSPMEPVVFFNPDGAFRFTRIPFDKQAALLNRIVGMQTSVLLGEGHTDAGIGLRLKESLPLPARARVHIVPAALPLEAYAALIDHADVFVSGDTGPLHVAAARKISRTNRYEFRNRTAVLSLFGATPARMSGYDSRKPGYLPAFQDAPSLCYTAGSPCRNITCLNKMLKTCPTVRCFEEMDIDALAGWVESSIRTPPPSISGRRLAANS
jgi:ADP-heptose:LPS heptosyltransferase